MSRELWDFRYSTMSPSLPRSNKCSVYIGFKCLNETLKDLFCASFRLMDGRTIDWETTCYIPIIL